MPDEETDGVFHDASALLSDLQQRASRLLNQLRAYQACLKAHQKDKEVEIRTFKRGVESEAKALKKVSPPQKRSNREPVADDPDAAEIEIRRIHSLRSSNLPFYEAVWSVALRSEAIVALGKHVDCQTKSKQVIAGSDRPDDGLVNFQTKSEKRGAVVDIMAKDGLEWIKVSTITEKRLLFEMAKEGWETYGDRAGSEDEHDELDTGLYKDEEDDSNQLELVKLAKVMCMAAWETRIRFKHPRVHFILPKIHEGVYDDVDAVIADIRSIGVTVTCGDHHSNSLNDLFTPFQDLNLRDLTPPSNILTHLLPTTSIFSPPPTPTLNIDCTILLALISDISHIPSPNLPPHPHNTSGTYHKAITNQIAAETTSPLLPTELYPLLASRALVCTSHAAQRMREIVLTMGTESERIRADIFFAENDYADQSGEALRKGLEAYTSHIIPGDLQLPLRIVDVDADALGLAVNTVHDSALSATDLRVLARIAQEMVLSRINTSVFLYGWRAGWVTVTSNRVVAHGLVRCINEVLDEEERVGGALVDVVDGANEFRGPMVYVCETARSLIGKEKQGG